LGVDVLEFGLDEAAPRAVYDELFAACPGALIQQSTWWAEVIQKLGPDRPIFLLCQRNGEALGGLPLYLYHGSCGNLLTSVPQAGPLGGVFLRPELAAADVDAAYAALIRRAVEIAERWQTIALTIITHPFEDDLALYQRYLEPHYTFENFTQYIPVESAVVAGSIQMRDSKTRNHLQRNLRRAAEAGLATTTEATDEEFCQWYKIHCQRHSEIGVQPLDRRLLANIRSILAPRGKGRFILVKHGNTIASGALFISHGRVADVFMISLNTEFESHAPNWLNITAALHWAAEVGIPILNWQSSPNRASGVYGFKRQWGSLERPFYFVTRLFRPAAEIRELGRERLRQEFPGHYVVPFGMLSDPNQDYFRK
jgi:CelD/BcsL family acetyltransferase involved in cellulose biosynthesis